ncbi:MAG: TetR/AcrR family transcriptional regulator [Ilumatobacter sp.]
MTGSGKTRWLLAGQQLLREFGVRGVKIEALVDTTNLTTGSFYHHFPNMAAYRKELAEFYGTAQVEENVETIADADPRDRLRRLAQIAREESMGALDAAMRDWAGSDPVAAGAVRALDATLLEHIAGAFRDLGHDEAGARIRAFVLFSAGVAQVHPPWPVGDSAETLLDILERADGS